jgi:hypothetical protein
VGCGPAATPRTTSPSRPATGCGTRSPRSGPYDLRFADASHGQVALFTSVEETDAVSPCAIRLGFRAGVVEQAEIVVARNKDEGFPFLGQRFDDKPAMRAEVPEASGSVARKWSRSPTATSRPSSATTA